MSASAGDPALDRVSRRSDGSAPFRFDLIVAGPGHPSESERVIVDVLHKRHKERPYDWVFMSYDASQKQGEFALDGKALSSESYRSLPDKDIMAGIVEYYVNSGAAPSAFAFGVMAEPACQVLPLDDWYGWAQSRDALRQLDASAGRLAAAAAVLEHARTAGEDDRSADSVRELLDLIRLRWTGTEWLTHRGDFTPLDIALTVRNAGHEKLVGLMSELGRHAATFYDASLRRTEAVVAGALERMRRTGARNAAMLIEIPWIEQAVAALVEADVGFEVVFPAKVEMRSMLDEARLLLGISAETTRPFEELFSGKRVRTRVEVLLEDSPDLAKARAQDWANAAQGLATRYELHHDGNDLKRAEECARRALGLDATMDNALWIQGELLTLQGQPEQALASLERAIALAPRKPNYWRGKAAALDRLGRTRAARGHFARAIHISPTDGSSWTAMGIHYHHHDRLAAACYCFSKGTQYGDEVSLQNQRILGCAQPRPWNCPLALQPVVIRFMNRLALPLHYGWDFERILGSLLVAGIVLLASPIWGTIVGALTGGARGAGLGFTISALAAVVTALLLFTAVAGAVGAADKVGTTGAEIALVLAIVGAWAGAHSGGSLVSANAQPILGRTVAIGAGILGAADGAMIGIIFHLAWHKWRRRRSTSYNVRAEIALMMAVAVLGAWAGAEIGNILASVNLQLILSRTVAIAAVILGAANGAVIGMFSNLALHEWRTRRSAS